MRILTIFLLAIILSVVMPVQGYDLLDEFETAGLTGGYGWTPQIQVLNGSAWYNNVTYMEADVNGYVTVISGSVIQPITSSSGGAGTKYGTALMEWEATDTYTYSAQIAVKITILEKTANPGYGSKVLYINKNATASLYPLMGGGMLSSHSTNPNAAWFPLSSGGGNATYRIYGGVPTPPEPPSADFTLSPNPPYIDPATISFTTNITGGTPTNWIWSFGDGSTWDGWSAMVPTPDPVVYGAGTYTISLYVNNSVGSTTHSETITVTNSSAPSGGTVLVGGTVADATTGSALQGALVTGTQGSASSSYTSTAAGLYNISQSFSTGQAITMAGTKTDYEPFSDTFTPYAAGNYTVDIYLLPTGNLTPPYDPPSGEVGSVAGLVQIKDVLTAVSSATVGIANDTWSDSTTTSGTGLFYFTDLCPGSYTLNATKSGLTSGDDETVTVTGGDTTYQNLELEASYNKTLTVIDATSFTPITNATVTASGSGSGTYTTDSDGQVVINSTYGILNLAITAEGYYAYSGAFSMTQSDESTVPLTKVPVQQQTAIWTPPQVVFQVIDANRNPIIGTEVMANAEYTTLPSGFNGAVSLMSSLFGLSEDSAGVILNRTAVHSGTTDSTGSIVFLMVPVIDYTVTVKDVYGINYTVNIMPKDTYYIIKTENATYQSQEHLALSGLNIYNGQSIYNASFYEPNSSYGTMANYVYDATNRTSGADCWFRLIDNGTVWWDNRTWALGSDLQVIEKTVPIVPYQQWRWGCQTI
jgi:hypothetical protein